MKVSLYGLKVKVRHTGELGSIVDYNKKGVAIRLDKYKTKTDKYSKGYVLNTKTKEIIAEVYSILDLELV